MGAATNRIIRGGSLLTLAMAVASCQMEGSSAPSAQAPANPPTTQQAAAPTTQAAPVAAVRKAAGIAGVYDVRAFGATGNGKTIDSPAINAAIDAAAAAGGGTVRFPAGTYLSYSIRLKSNITLYLDQGSRILAANINVHGGTGYDLAEDIGDTARYQDYGHSHWHNSLIWGEKIENITITGPGLIDGGLWQADGSNASEVVIRNNPGERGTRNGVGGFLGLSDGLGGGGGGRGAATQPGGGRGRGGRGRGGFGGAGQGAPDGTPALGPDGQPLPATQPGGGRGRGGFNGPGGPAGQPFTQTTAADLSIPFREQALPRGVGNKAISLKLCKNVTLSDFSVLRGGHFALLATGVDNFTIDNLKIDTNRDGFDIDGCRNVRISNCAVNSPFDDAIVLKSSWGLGYPQSCENTTITNCLVSGGWSVGSMLDGTYVETNPGTGRIKFGTESNGGFKNITISNCVFDRCQGLALEAVDGAVIDNISISNITMREIGSLPIFIRLGNRQRMPRDKAAVGAIRHVNISDIVAQNRAAQNACVISGIPGYQIEDVHINNVRIIWPGGGAAELADIVPPEREYQYPEPGMFGAMPAYGFFIRHVKDIALNNIDMSVNAKDMRPPFYLEDVNGAEFINIKAPHETGVPMFNLKKVGNFRTHNVRGMTDTVKEKVEAEKF
ncbi:MAG TPA: glycosyl hydrolase family 28-related protein [Tepidisphaeraceae bacterium]|nr:glycosyl hydrolase family 28-related protein [Tepidisphaeraceae bacterium]